MKLVCLEYDQATCDPEGGTMEDIVKDADRLVSCLANKVAKNFINSSRYSRYVLTTLMMTFQNEQLAHAVKESTLDSLITELLLWLLDEKVPRMDDGSQLLNALNVLMHKILDNAEWTSSFVVLINLLWQLDSSRWPSPASNESLATKNQKFSDLVAFFLSKLTKRIPDDTDLDCILQSIHVYLQELGMEKIRRRAGADDKSLCMVKTVLCNLVKLRGTAIKGHLFMVPIDMEPQPIIVAYIDLYLPTSAATHWGDSAANNSSPATPDAQLKGAFAVPKKTVKTTESTSSSFSGGLDSLTHRKYLWEDHTCPSEGLGKS